jgi:hypothetical protein
MTLTARPTFLRSATPSAAPPRGISWTVAGSQPGIDGGAAQYPRSANSGILEAHPGRNSRLAGRSPVTLTKFLETRFIRILPVYEMNRVLRQSHICVKTSVRKTKTGEVRYPQLAHDEWGTEKCRSVPKGDLRFRRGLAVTRKGIPSGSGAGSGIRATLP